MKFGSNRKQIFKTNPVNTDPAKTGLFSPVRQRPRVCSSHPELHRDVVRGSGSIEETHAQVRNQVLSSLIQFKSM